MKRRELIKNAAWCSLGLMIAPAIVKAAGKSDPVLLLVSGWQDVNIGDITHTPGLIALLKHRLPKAKIILWKKAESKRVDDMLMKYFPDLSIVHGTIDKNLIPQTDEVKQAFAKADLFIHGSGPSVVGADYTRSWCKQTNKNFGIFGVTIQEVTPILKELLAKASFIFTRETASIQVLEQNGLSGSQIAFAPDATFVLDICDNNKGEAFLTENKLEKRKFICVVPRLRYTPYWQFAERTAYTPERIAELEAINAAFKEVDHAKLRAAIIKWVRTTGYKVLVCPEMTYELDIMDELLIDPLPNDVKPFVSKRGYWMPDEAASVYRNAHTVLSFECHSPIIAAANGTPCFYLRQPTDTIKGQMYYDLGFNDWVFEIDNTTGAQIAERLMEIHSNYPEALATVKEAIKKVNRRYDESFAIIKRRVPLLA